MNRVDPASPFGHKIRPRHRDRLAVVSIRQSTHQQVVSNRESADLQYQLRQRAVALGWADDRVLVVGDDQGISGTSVENRPGFQRLLTEVSLGRVGGVFGREMSRRARSCADWHRLLELCALFRVLLADADGVYDPADFNNRLLLGLEGTMREAELHILRARLHQGKLNKARRGELLTCVPVGYARVPDGGIALGPDEQVRPVVSLVFAKFAELGSLTKTHAYFVTNNIQIGLRVYKGPGAMNPIPKSFGAQEFGDADLGDVRRVRRLVALADACLGAPNHALPDKLHDPGGYQGALRVLRSPHVTHAAVLAPHQARTLDRAEAHPGTVLMVHDTTDLDFSGHRTLANQLGPIGNRGGRGLLCHNTLAVDAGTGEILGLVAQQLHARVAVGKNESRAIKRARVSRESRLWVRALDELGPPPATNRWVHIADRGADAFEFLSRLVRTGERFVVRAQHDRSLGPGAELFATIGATEGAGGWELELCATPTRAARKAWVRASATGVTLPPPHNRKGEYPTVPIRLHVVRVWEPDPPAGAVPLGWVLLTSEEVTDVAGLRRVSEWYGRRVWSRWPW